MELTTQEIKILLEIIDNTAIPYKQSRELVTPLVGKLQQQLSSLLANNQKINKDN